MASKDFRHNACHGKKLAVRARRWLSDALAHQLADQVLDEANSVPGRTILSEASQTACRQLVKLLAQARREELRDGRLARRSMSDRLETVVF